MVNQAWFLEHVPIQKPYKIKGARINKWRNIPSHISKVRELINQVSSEEVNLEYVHYSLVKKYGFNMWFNILTGCD